MTTVYLKTKKNKNARNNINRGFFRKVEPLKEGIYYIRTERKTIKIFRQ